MAEIDWHADRSGVRLLDAAPESEGIDLAGMRAYRLGRIRAEMVARQVDALLLCDAVNIRYATGARNMQVFSSRNSPSRYLILTADASILYEFTGCHHLADNLDTIDEVRAATTASFVAAGPNIAVREKAWAADMGQTICDLVGRNCVIGVERMNAGVAVGLAAQPVQLVDAQECVEMARAIKSADEVKCIVASLRATETAVAALRDSIRPGITENELWSVLHQSVIAQNGEYCETRLLSSGGRSNPWFQESSSKALQPNELVALDTDVVGCLGYYSDFSRTFHVGPDKPTAQQRALYGNALEQVQHNMELMRPGMSFRDYAHRAWDIPTRYYDNRYYLSAHGCGMTGEYPYLFHRDDFGTAGYDGELLPGMTICVESYIGEHNGHEGVKLEQQVLITEAGNELLSLFPFEDALLG